MNELSDLLLKAMRSSEARGFKVIGIHASKDFVAALYDGALILNNGTVREYKIGDDGWVLGVPIMVTIPDGSFFEGTGFYLDCVPKEPPEEPKTMNESSDLQLHTAILDSRTHGFEVMEIHVSEDFCAALWGYSETTEALALSSDGVRRGWFDGIPLEVANLEGDWFYFVCLPKVRPEEPTTLFGYPVVFTDSPALRWPRRASVSDTIVSALRSELHEETTWAECEKCPCLRGGARGEYKCGAGYDFHYCGMVAIVTREKSIIFNHKYDD